MESALNFGRVAFNKNTNLKQSGSGNSGIVESNVNLQLVVTNCILNIFQSTNTKITAENSNVNSQFSTNSVIAGNNNTVVIKDVSNLKQNGNGNKLTVSSGLNLNFLSDNTEILAEKVRNGKLTTKSMIVNLSNSTNIKVEGDSGEVNIRNANNQTVARSTSTGAKQNCITFSSAQSEDPPSGASPIGRAFVAMFGTRNAKEERLRVSTTYERNATIDGREYNLDGVNFRVEPKPNDLYDVSVLERDLDAGSIQKHVGPTEVQINATKNGTKHSLKFQAPCIMNSTLDTSKFSFSLDNGHPSNI